MRKKCLITALLFLSVWGMARSAGQRTGYAPGSSPPTQQPKSADMTQATPASTAHTHDRLLEGCVAGSRDNLALTDAAGKVYLLQGDIAELSAHIGQQASIIGTEIAANASPPAEGRATFIVKKVKLIASICSPFK